MSARSPWWIDWSLARGAILRELPGRFALLLVLALFYLAMILSGGVSRLLAGQWSVTAILSRQVSDEEGRGIAGHVARLPAVRTAVYKDPESAWKEFLSAYPGLEALRAAGGNPLPGYVEIRFRPERLTERDIAAVTGVLRPLPQVERILSGGEMMSRMLRFKRWADGTLWAGLGLACAAVFWVLALQERARVQALKGDVAFLAERGVPAGAIGRRRAASAALVGGLLASVAAALAVLAMASFRNLHPALGAVLGGVEDLAEPPRVFLAAAFPPAAAFLWGAASLFGWRAARSRPG